MSYMDRFEVVTDSSEDSLNGKELTINGVVFKLVKIKWHGKSIGYVPIAQEEK